MRQKEKEEDLKRQQLNKTIIAKDVWAWVTRSIQRKVG